MTERSVLVELKEEVVPIWCGKLERYIKEAEEKDTKPTTGIIITPSGVEENTSTARILTPGIEVSPAPPDTPPINDKQPGYLRKSFASPHGLCRLDSKPEPTRTRFSSLTSPVVIYDGESQRMLADLWTLLNNKRGGLRREMMTVKRRQELAAPRMMDNIEVDSETEGGSGKEDEDLEHSSEVLRFKLKMEREKMKRMNRRAGGGISGVPVGVTRIGALPFKRARTMAGPPVSTADPNTPWGVDDAKMKSLLEAIDDNLDKACKVAETVAFVWLKGDPYEGHLKFIVGRLKDTMARIEASGLLKTGEEAPKLSSNPAIADSKLIPPPPATTATPTTTGRQPTPEKSDATMREACPVSVVMNNSENRQQVIPATLEVSTTDDINPEAIVNMYRSSRAGPSVAPRSRFKPPSAPPQLVDPFSTATIEVEEDDDDDEGIEC